MLNKYELTEALKMLGQAQVAVGDPFTNGGMAMLGMTQGEIRAEINEKVWELAAEDYTGAVPHQASVNVDAATIIAPVVVEDAALLAKISATGTASGGWSSPQPVVETSALLIPEAEVGAGLSFPQPAGPWVPAAPELAVWFWRAYITRGALPFRIGNNIVTEVRIRAMFYAPNPGGHKVYTIGDPVTAGITTIDI